MKPSLTFWKYPCVFICLALTACTSRDGDLNLYSPDQDLEMGMEYDRQMAAQPESYPFLDERQYPGPYRYLRRIVDSLVKSEAILHRDEFTWQVKIIHDDSVRNAFCTPGGYIYVYTGLIRYLESEDQLAGVIGHEIAHADLRHSTEQLTMRFGIGLLIQLFAGDASTLAGMAGNLAGLTFSRGDESEADMMSVRYLMDSGYDPRGVARFFEKMQEEGETAGPLVFLSTHPNPENRVQRIIEEWKRLGSKGGNTFAEEYEAFKQELP